MVYIIPVEDMPEHERVAKIKEAVNYAYDAGKRLIKAPALVDRPAKPADFGISGEEFTFNVSSGENTIVNRTLDDDEVIVIYAIGNISESPQVERITFGTGSEVFADIFIGDLYSKMVPEGYLSKPIIYSPKSKMVIKAYAKGSNTAEKLYFKAIVVEKEGKNITKPK